MPPERTDSRSRLVEHLEKIPYFVAVVREGSIQAAAQRLRLSQPSLSRSMHVLEEALGVALLRRGRRGVTLTSAGRELHAFAEPLLAQAFALEKSLQGGTGEIRGEVRLGTHEVLVREFWPQLVKAMSKKAPHLKLSLFTTPSIGELRRRLEMLELDMIVGAEVSAMPSLRRHQIRSDTYEVLASPAFCKAHGIKRRQALSVEQWESLPLLYAAEVIAGPGILLGQALRAVGVERASLYQVKSLESVLALTVADLGLGLLPYWMVDSEVKAGELWHLTVDRPGMQKLGVHSIYVAELTPRQHEAPLKLVRESVVAQLSLNSSR
jgi:DNA-binding transcriptional LysR family regulator